MERREPARARSVAKKMGHTGPPQSPLNTINQCYRVIRRHGDRSAGCHMLMHLILSDLCGGNVARSQPNRGGSGCRPLELWGSTPDQEHVTTIACFRFRDMEVECALRSTGDLHSSSGLQPDPVGPGWTPCGTFRTDVLHSASPADTGLWSLTEIVQGIYRSRPAPLHARRYKTEAKSTTNPKASLSHKSVRCGATGASGWTTVSSVDLHT
ncbi:Hypothetical protein SMAX5B_008449 [Scophthalmus maximus]|uniref:Uncharacterized protein n=1 Tax=Scophthalmus maximus TaxID=52904 RepID=A0A2U9B3P9_SCOMX|nr:Hypothetical protein SMAX5B_008449 [Scophthalmus maximus]